MEDVCRVCRSVSQEPLFHPCKCSGSMKYIHQSCLEEWLQHSGKKHCDICNHVFEFSPVYHENAPSRIGFITGFQIVVKRILKQLVYYCRVLLAGFLWLIWVPFVTCWTYRIFLNPKRMFDFQKTTAQPILSVFLKDYLSPEHLATLEHIELFYDWPHLLRVFLSDVFEGQIVAAVIVVLGLMFLLLREYLANVEPRDELLEQRNELERQLEELRRRRQNVEPRLRQNENPLVLPQNNNIPVPETIAPEHRALAEIDSEDAIGSNAQEEILTTSNPESLETTTSENNHESLFKPDMTRITDTPRRYNLRPRKEKYESRKKLERKSAEDISSTDTSNINPSNEDNKVDLDHVESSSKDSILRYFEDGERLLQDKSKEDTSKEKEWKNERAQDKVDKKGKQKMAEEDIQVETEAEIDQSEPDFQSQVKKQREADRLLLQTQKVIQEPPEEIEDQHLEPERENLDLVVEDLQNLMEIIRNENEFQVNPVNPPEPDAQVNIGLNVGIADGEIVAQIEVNDVNAFLDLVGVNGPILKLLQNVVVIHLMVILIVCLGLWGPHVIGSSIFYLLNEIIGPNVEKAASVSIKFLQSVSDPIIEPIVDIIVGIVHENGTLIKNETTASILSSISRNATNSTVGIDKTFIQSLQEDLASVFFGYVIIAILTLLYARHVGMLNHPVIRSIGQLFHSINTNLMLVIKITVFVVMELAIFPFYCGVFIDLLTIPIFGPGATIAQRYAMYTSHPWMFVFVHWILGSTFMYQFASYVSLCRETVRRGVLWFVRDPSDPNFNAMREIMNRSVGVQLRKLWVGVLLYGTVLLAVVGGSVQLIVLCDYITGKYFGNDSIFRIFPLRLEYYDTLTEIPFDLFFFQFGLPQIIRIIGPKAKFRYLNSLWFNNMSRLLRLSAFMIGGEYPDEESDTEDAVEIRHMTVGEPKKTVSKQVVNEDGSVTNLVSEDEDEWEDEPSTNFRVEELFEEEKVIKIKPNRKRLRYMRVPNHDTVEVIPGEKMLIYMDGDAEVFGRPTETPEQVANNWTKVYVPNFFYPRIFLFLYAMMLSFSVFIPTILFAPLIIGRYFFYKLDKLAVVHIIIPGYTIPIASKRPDVPTHDLFSFFAGLCVLYSIGYVFYAFYKLLGFGKHALRRRSSIRRRPGVNPGQFDNAEMAPSVQERFTTWWERKGRFALYKFFKASYLVLVVGIVIPTLVGSLLNVYLMSPIHHSLGRVPVSYILMEWSTGAMATRVVYNILLLAPRGRIPQIILEATNAGLVQLNLTKLNANIFFPFISFSVLAISIPYATNFIEIIADLPKDFLAELVKIFGAVTVIGCYVGYRIIKNAFLSLKNWLEHLKDDQYLIGRRLQNIQEVNEIQ